MTSQEDIINYLRKARQEHADIIIQIDAAIAVFSVQADNIHTDNIKRPDILPTMNPDWFKSPHHSLGGIQPKNDRIEAALEHATAWMEKKYNDLPF